MLNGGIRPDERDVPRSPSLPGSPTNKPHQNMIKRIRDVYCASPTAT